VAKYGYKPEEYNCEDCTEVPIRNKKGDKKRRQARIKKKVR
jgi:hypothetical protein